MATFSNILATEKGQKGQNNYVCESCDYKCSKKYSWDRHLLTLKHQESTNGNTLGAKGQLKAYSCENCGKEYSERTGLWKHKQKCTIQQNNNIINGGLTEQLVIELVRQNKELLEIVKNGTTSHSHNTTNSHNKAFNLQFFLNETCKDAMNIMDFVDSLKLQLSDLESVGKLGYVEGISNIIIKNLKEMDVHKRPVHCSDSKREIMYIKDEDKWEKENEQKQKLRKAIKRVAFKNEKLLPKYKEEHPGCNYSDSKFSDQYSKLVIEAMGGMGNNVTEKEDKIIKKIAKEVIINKFNN